MQLKARIVPNARGFSLSLAGDALRVRVRAKAEDGKANAELVRALGDALGMKVTIVRGAKSRDKVLEIEGGHGEVLAKLQEIIDKQG